MSDQWKDEWLKPISYPGRHLPLVGLSTTRDEVYLIHGFGNLLVLRRQKEYFKVVGEVLEPYGVLPGVDMLVGDFEGKVERDEPGEVDLQIC